MKYSAPWRTAGPALALLIGGCVVGDPAQLEEEFHHELNADCHAGECVSSSIEPPSDAPAEDEPSTTADSTGYTIFLPFIIGGGGGGGGGAECGAEWPAPVNAQYEQDVITLVNQERAVLGLLPLKYNEDLAFAARYHALDMARDNYFSHDTMDRVDGALELVCDPWKRIGIYYSAANGENAAAGYATPAAVVQGWMNSPGHKANILNPATRDIGVGFYEGMGDYYYYWVQDFGTGE